MYVIDYEDDGTFEVVPFDGYEPYEGPYRPLVDLVTDALCSLGCSDDDRSTYVGLLEDLVGTNHAAYADLTGQLARFFEWVDAL